MKRTLLTIIAAAALASCTTPSAPATSTKGEELVRGAAFKDMILPMPIYNGLESEGLWGCESVIPRDRDNGMEDDEWSYWGGNPIKCSDGRYHIALCRWSASTGHNGWHKSEVAHAVSDLPTGPYQITRTIVDMGHNPEVVVLADSTFVLHINNTRAYATKDMAAEWEYIGNITMNSRGFKGRTEALGTNLTITHRPDGSFIAMQKDGDILISRDNILGPYQMASINNYKFNGGYAEDPVIWRSRHQYHAIYNNALMKESIHIRSLDGLDWKIAPGLAYDRSSTRYEDGTRTTWGKFERPKVIQDSYGRAQYLTLGVIDVEDKNADLPGDIHNSKHMVLPLTVEKLISIISPEEITASTERIVVKVEGEEGFNPARDINIESLRFGSDSEVDFGGGCEVVESRTEGGDLILTFEGYNGLTQYDYDFKLLGEDVEGELIVGYAPLVDGSELRAKLIALPVVAGADGTIEGVVENLGFESSAPSAATLIEHSREGWRSVCELQIPALKPYEQYRYSAAGDAAHCEYSIEFHDQTSYLGEWRMVDESESAVEFSGEWQSIEGDDYYMGATASTNTIGSSVKFSFTGTKARVFGTLTRGGGTYDLYLDGEKIKSVLLSFGEHFATIFETERLPYGEHTLELVSTNAKPATLDAFSFEG